MATPLRVLILEDRVTDLQLMLSELRQAGFDPHWERVETEPDYLARLESTLDVILSDYSMPQFSAPRALSLLNHQGLDIPFIIVSGSIGEELALEALRQGAADYLLKDRMGRLGQAVKQALEQKQLRHENRKAEEALRSAETLFRKLVENALVGIQILQDGRYAYANSKLAEIFGYSEAEMLALDSWMAIVAEEDREMVADQVHRRLSGETPHANYVFRGLRKDRSVIDVEIRSDRTELHGRPAILGMLIDISERRRGEIALRERACLASLGADVGLALTGSGTLRDILHHCVESMVRNLDAAFARIWTLNDVGTVLELQASAGMYTHLNGPHSRVQVGQFKIGLIAQERQPHLTNDVLTDPRISNPEWARREGMIAFAGYPLLIEDRAVGVMAMFARQPLTQTTLDALALVANQIALGIERKRTEQSLRYAEEKYRNIVENSVEGIFQMTPTGRYLTANSALARIYGFESPAGLMASIDDGDLQHYVDPERHEEFTQLMRDHGVVKGLEAKVFRKDRSEIWISTNARVVYAEDVLLYYEGSIEDISERKRGEQRMLAQHAVTRVLEVAASLAEATPLILQAICETMEWEFGGLWQVDSEDQVLRCVETWHQPTMQADEFANVTKQLTFACEIGLPGRVWASRQPVWIQDVMQDINFLRKQSAAKISLHGAMGFPIILENEVLGVLDFFSHKNAQPEEPLLRMMTAIGSQIGQFIERKRTAESLRETEEKYHSIVENAIEGIFQTTPDGRYLTANPALVRMYGFRSPEELMTTNNDIEQHLYVDLGRRAEFVRLMQEQGVVKRFESNVFRKDGSTIWISENARAVHDDAGELLFYEGTVEDISERKRSEEAMRELNQQLQLLIQASPLAVITIDLNGIVLMWNPAAERIFGWSETETLGRTIPTVPKDQWGELRASLDDQLMGIARSGTELRRLRKDGTLVDVSLWTAPLHDQNGRMTASMGLFADTTNQKRLEEQFRQSQKMEAVGKLAGGVAHDFNNLLTVIIGYSEVILDGLRDDDPLKELLEQIKQAGERAAALTRQLLAFSRKQVLMPTVIDFNSLITDMGKMLRRLIGENIDMVVQPHADLWKIIVDVGQMEQVLMNLVVNSRDAMPHGGKLTIETANVELDDAYVSTHSEARVGEHVLLAVSDTGCGMDKATQARIFEPFFTTKGLDKGTGLGLATVHGIVKQSDGHIEVYSELGLGTTFKIYLPRKRQGALSNIFSKEQSEIPRGTETVLLVEDEEGVRTLARLVLQKNGYNVLEATQGEEAIKLSEEYPGTIHLLVTDVVMPGISGRQLAEHLLLLRPDLKVLFMSGYTDDAIVRHGVLNRDTPFIQKPFTNESLALKVREVFDKQS